MNNKILLSVLSVISMLVISCGSNTQQSASTQSAATAAKDTVVPPAGDESKGYGKFKDVQLTHPLDQALVQKGKAIYDVKCSSCHKNWPTV